MEEIILLKKTIGIFVIAVIIQAVMLWTFGIKDSNNNRFRIDVKECILDNGLKILIVENPEIPIVVCRINYNVGAINEKEGMTGASHFLEHMMFKGTEIFGVKDGMREKETELFMEEDIFIEDIREFGEYSDPEISKENLISIRKNLDNAKILNDLDNIIKKGGGVGYNAFTNYDQTCYMWSVPSNKLELWFLVESDRMKNLVLRDFHTEIKVVLEERRMRVENSPSSRVSSGLMEQVLSGIPYGRPEWIIGSAKDIADFKRNEIAKYYKTYYTPNNAVMVLAGGVDNNKAIELAKKYFGNIPRSDIELIDNSIFNAPIQNEENRVIIKHPASDAAAIGYKTVPANHSDATILYFISKMLSGGKTSPFYESLIKTQIANELKTYSVGYKYAGMMEISFSPNGKHNIEEIEDIIYREIEKLKDGLILAEEIRRTKKQIKADFVRGLGSLDSLVGDIIDYESVIGDWRKINDFIPAIEKITKDDITAVANKYFIPQNKSMVIMRDSRKEAKNE